MTTPNVRREVAPLELFFDLVFVFAVGQLTHHLLAHLGRRGAAETLVALVAVCGVWTFTSFEVTLLDVERGATRVITVVVMGLGLFMNAGITRAFAGGPWLFAVPMLVALVGPGGYAALAAPDAELRRHFARVLLWFAVSTPLWVVGAAADPETRLWWWAAAALVDLAGTWTAHPFPGRTTATERIEFDARHMLERMRLFLIILLGETVLALGRVLSEHTPEVLTVLVAVGGFASLVGLWAVYFGRSEEQVEQHTEAAEDPVRSVHIGMNVLYGVLTGLVTFAAGIELVLAHVHDARAGVGGALALAGPAIYLLSQTIYFRVETGTGWRPRAIGTGVLAVAAVAAYWLPGYAVVALLVVVLAALAAALRNQ
ncbi:low temperature requirement protein A [Amycolatopsis australiensis]|uniref:Low temperature requirement protein LtrA n=1 Tax=Amycolatopsis australiensis TaxID=546364 RepID=A0A1K1S6G8_9PSEU|nr:low temperature requirement protein A [Amycolatopsis australiensis]SFW79918.1 Low temperature requirement protein LtrA [Amycolatopsis australiensis]